MDIKRIIEQEVDKEEWGLELPKYVAMGGPKGTTLRLTDRGTYHRDAGKWDVKYRVEGDKIYSVSPIDSVDNKELVETSKEEWYEQNKDYYEEDDQGDFNWAHNSHNFNQDNDLLESNDFGWAEEVQGDDFHIGTRFRHKGESYDYYSWDVWQITSIDPDGYVGIEKVVDKGVELETSTNANKIPYTRFKEAYDSGSFENESVRNDIDMMIYPGSKFVIENAWWEGEKDGIRHPKEEGEIVLEITEVDEYGNCKYKVIESDLPIGEPIGSEDEAEIDEVRNHISTGWWKQCTKSFNEGFEWAEEVPATRTLGEMFDNGMIKKGDTVTVNGNVNIRGKVEVGFIHTEFHFKEVNPNNFIDCLIEITPEVDEVIDNPHVMNQLVTSWGRPDGRRFFFPTKEFRGLEVR